MSGPARSRLTDAKHPEITTALCTAPRPATLARVRTLARMCGHAGRLAAIPSLAAVLRDARYVGSSGRGWLFFDISVQVILCLFSVTG